MGKWKGRPGSRAETMRKIRASVLQGKQATLPLESCTKKREPKYVPSKVIKYYYKLSLAREWGVPVQSIRIYGCALPEIKIFK